MREKTKRDFKKEMILFFLHKGHKLRADSSESADIYQPIMRLRGAA